MHRDEVVGGVHPLGEFDRDVENAVQIVGVGDVELVGREGEDVGLELDPAAMDGGHHLGPFDERGRRGSMVAGNRDREGRGTGLACGDEFRAALPRVPVEDVVHGACRIAG